MAVYNSGRAAPSKTKLLNKYREKKEEKYRKPYYNDARERSKRKKK